LLIKELKKLLFFSQQPAEVSVFLFFTLLQVVNFFSCVTANTFSSQTAA
jgi:hypothetical protein